MTTFLKLCRKHFCSDYEHFLFLGVQNRVHKLLNLFAFFFRRNFHAQIRVEISDGIENSELILKLAEENSIHTYENGFSDSKSSTVSRRVFMDF